MGRSQRVPKGKPSEVQPESNIRVSQQETPEWEPKNITARVPRCIRQGSEKQTHQEYFRTEHLIEILELVGKDGEGSKRPKMGV